jgi:hypothetical protein
MFEVLPLNGMLEINSRKNHKSEIHNKHGLPWYLNRLRLMSMSEIGLRLYRKVRAMVWKIILPWGWGGREFFLKEIAGSSGDRLAELKNNFPIKLDPEFRDRYNRTFSLEKVKETGEDLIKGRIPVFKYQIDTQGGLPDWHRDVLSEVSWPKVFFSHINHNDLRYGRVIHVWELNRHFHFYDLGKAFYFTRDDRLARALLNHLESWIDQNPIGIGINWVSPMECGLRLISWLWGLFFLSETLQNSPGFSLLLTPERQKKIMASIYWQTFFIEKNLSKYSSANNHLIGEALALFWVGALVPSFSRSKKWKKQGWKILCREIESQVFPDGVPREQSSRYLFYLFDLYTLAIIMAQKENQAVSPVVWDRLEKICEYIMAQMDEDGHLPDWGDSSDGLACKLHRDVLFPYRSLLTTGAVWFKRGDLKHWGGKMDERNFWLFSGKALSEYEEIAEDPTEKRSRIFPDGGQIILRKGRGVEEAVLAFDAGPFGFLSIAAHAHADALSFTLSAGGTPIIVDPGTFLYHDGGPWRDYFRGTRAHNTVEVDSQDQALSGGPFMWLSKPDGFIMQADLDSRFDYIRAFHSGYERLSGGVRHERSILFVKEQKFWIIKDLLYGEGSHSLNLRFHFHPQCFLTALKNNLFQVSIEKPVLYFKLDSQLTIALHRGEEVPISGWFSSAFGEKGPAITLQGKVGFKNRIELQTVLWMP